MKQPENLRENPIDGNLSFTVAVALAGFKTWFQFWVQGGPHQL